MKILPNRSLGLIPRLAVVTLAAAMLTAALPPGEVTRAPDSVSIRLVLHGGPLARSLTIPILSATAPSGVAASAGGGSTPKLFEVVLDGAQHAPAIQQFVLQGSVFPRAAIEHVDASGVVQHQIQMTQAVFSSITAPATRSQSYVAVLSFDSMR